MLNILIAEDDDDLRHIYVSILHDRLNARIVSVSSANEAILVLKENSGFDIIVSDYKMLNGMGTVLLDYVVKYHSDIPFIFFTSSVDPMIGKTHDKFLGVIDKMKMDELILLIERQISS